jgi:hypothetical protein
VTGRWTTAESDLPPLIKRGQKVSGPEAFKDNSSGSKYSGKGGVVGVVGATGVVVSDEVVDEVVVVSGAAATVLVELISAFLMSDSVDGGSAGAGTGSGVITNVKRGP